MQVYKVSLQAQKNAGWEVIEHRDGGKQTVVQILVAIDAVVLIIGKFQYSPICLQAPMNKFNCTKFCTGIGVTDLITCTKFFGNKFRGINCVA